MKTQAEINTLKSQWELDPVWDIETTEGFEDHVDELRAFKWEREYHWQSILNRELADKCKLWGLEYPEQKNLVGYLNNLERQLEEMKEKLIEHGIF